MVKMSFSLPAKQIIDFLQELRLTDVGCFSKLFIYDLVFYKNNFMMDFFFFFLTSISLQCFSDYLSFPFPCFMLYLLQANQVVCFAPVEL